MECPGVGKCVADIIGLMLLGATAIYIAYRNARFKGYSGKEEDFCGYYEQNMLSFFVNFIATIAYFGRVVSNQTCEPGFPVFTSIQYLEYIFICPLLVMDLMWSLNSPYKWSCSALTLVAIIHAVAGALAPKPANYIWFGAGCFVFSVAYFSIMILSRERLKVLTACAKEDKGSLIAVYRLKMACGCFFFIWVWYPVLYVLSPAWLELITNEQRDIIHMLLDLGAKGVYGVVSIGFRSGFNKKLLDTFDETEYLHPTPLTAKRRSVIMKITIGAEEGSTTGGGGGGP